MAENSPTHPRVLRLKQVLDRVGLSRSTIYDRMNPASPRYDSSFPKPIKIGSSAVGWLESSISKWIESRFNGL
ncbi:AlpA family transcriptional regulator [Pseudomonas sp. FP1911]|uniref:helix-turn-helix transcriptional regulator n=1 Tax=Pseudomonas sp. FP1911 TaxID=2954081 RepID=UPI002735D4D4|nr:AlpA family transcriptional regulator [Pseudomonas sp. FP1911]WLG78937.1 AlpA family transcriptional regulator [Pseudomonas sp. FP1911]